MVPLPLADVLLDPPTLRSTRRGVGRSTRGRAEAARRSAERARAEVHHGHAAPGRRRAAEAQGEGRGHAPGARESGVEGPRCGLVAGAEAEVYIFFIFWGGGGVIFFCSCPHGSTRFFFCGASREFGGVIGFLSELAPPGFVVKESRKGFGGR